MNWERELIRLYDNNSDKSANEQGAILCNLYHSTASAKLQVTIDMNGNFLRAAKVSKGDARTIIPVTMKSLGRTSGPAPHALCDTLKYLSRSYGQYATKKKDYEKLYHRPYMEALREWKDSDYGDPKIDAIYTYLEKDTLITDLIHTGVIDEKGMKDEFVRFVVLRADNNANNICSYTAECWLDEVLQNKYIRYYRSKLEGRKKLYDYITGTMQVPTYNNPKGILSEGSQAKLISADDNKGLTYRGRFGSKEETFSIGVESSFKLHSALKWIIQRQGRRYGDLTVVTWESDLLPAPM